MKYLQLNNIGCYKRAFALSNYVWNIVVKWDWFAKRTVGVQFVTAIDSNSANIYEHILFELQALPKEIHQLIKFTNEKLRV